MKLPLSLLKKFIDLDKSPSEIAKILTSTGIEVDGIENPTPPFSNIVAAKVLSTKKHPEADRLCIAIVFDGNEEVEVVCGAPNCRAGIITAFAKIGATLTDEKGGTWSIKKSKIRGVVSNGMLCSATELGISKEGDGILEFDESIKPGADLVKELWDPVFELSLTPNLGHCFSAIGVARELAAFLRLPLKHLPTNYSINSSHSIDQKIHVSVKSKNCLRYTLRCFENITVALSPFWLKKTLESCGMRSINNVVDITNLIMLELGQPMHAFDLNLLAKQKIEVVDQLESQNFLCLDQTERQIPIGSCVIKDGEKPIAIGGVIGGKNSAVSENTTTIALESATFDSIMIRKTTKQLSLRTESSQRFEKKTDPNISIIALDRASYLLQTLCGAHVVKGTIDLIQKPIEVKKIECRVKRVNQILGTNLSFSEIEEIFLQLGFGVKSHMDSFTVQIPSFRNDINIEVDLIEEVARIYGYDNISQNEIKYQASTLNNAPLYLFENKVRTFLLGQGVDEFLTCDLISPKLCELLHEESMPKSSLIEVMRPKSIDNSVLRPSLLPAFLQLVSHNLSFQNKDISGFEIGKIHFKKEDKYFEPTMLSILLMGEKSKKEAFDFFDLKGIFENLLLFLRIKKAEFTTSKHPNFHPSRQTSILIDGIEVGVLGQLHPEECLKQGIKEPLYFAECNLESLMEKSSDKKRFVSLPIFPSSERDWTITLEEKTPIESVLKEIKKQAPQTLEKVFFLDLYQNESLGNKKNVTFRFIYRDPTKTLSFEEVDSQHQKIINSISY